MKAWQETSRIAAELLAELDAGRGAVLALLLRVKGSAYRRPGAKLLIRSDGSIVGNVSGGCLESDLRERAIRILEAGRAEAIHYDTSDDEKVAWGLGLGCNGQLDLWALPIRPGSAAWVRGLGGKLDGDAPFSVRYSLSAEAAPVIGDATRGDGCRFDGDVFVDVLHPPPHLVVLGAGDDSVPLARLAVEAGFRVTVADHREALLDARLYPGVTLRLQRPDSGLGALPSTPDTFVVVKAHHIGLDRQWTRLYASTVVPYVGLLGPRARREEIVASLPGTVRDRIYGPCGLDIGAEGAEQIAQSIVAEAIAVRSGRRGGFLRHRDGAIHSDA